MHAKKPYADLRAFIRLRRVWVVLWHLWEVAPLEEKVGEGAPAEKLHPDVVRGALLDVELALHDVRVLDVLQHHALSRHCRPNQHKKCVSEMGISPIPPYKTRFFRLWRINILILRKKITHLSPRILIMANSEI